MSLTKRNLSHEDFRNNGEHDFDFDEYMYYKRQEYEYRQEYMELLWHEQGKLKEAINRRPEGDIRSDDSSPSIH